MGAGGEADDAGRGEDKRGGAGGQDNNDREAGTTSQGGGAELAWGEWETHKCRRQKDVEDGQVGSWQAGEDGQRDQPEGKEAGWVDRE